MRVFTVCMGVDFPNCSEARFLLFLLFTVWVLSFQIVQKQGFFCVSFKQRSTEDATRIDSAVFYLIEGHNQNFRWF